MDTVIRDHADTLINRVGKPIAGTCFNGSRIRRAGLVAGPKMELVPLDLDHMAVVVGHKRDRLGDLRRCARGQKKEGDCGNGFHDPRKGMPNGLELQMTTEMQAIAKRGEGGRWVKGTVANPAGRPKGTPSDKP